MVEQKRREVLKSLEKQELKQHVVHDAQQRPRLIFETPTDSGDGAPALVTEYVYINATESIIISRKEYTGKWQSEWDAGFTFDPNADYDVDADGIE